MTEKRKTSQGYIIRILQHFATKLRNITNFVMLFQAVMKFLSRLVWIKISLIRGKVYSIKADILPPKPSGAAAPHPLPPTLLKSDLLSLLRPTVYIFSPSTTTKKKILFQIPKIQTFLNPLRIATTF
jgi:hypothetical protein